MSIHDDPLLWPVDVFDDVLVRLAKILNGGGTKSVTPDEARRMKAAQGTRPKPWWL